MRALAALLKTDRALAGANHKGITPLHYCGLSALGKNDAARQAGFVRCGKLLLEAGAKADAKADVGGLAGIRPLQCACWTGGNIDLARLLLDRGADPKECLSFALGHFQRHGHGHNDIAELLLESGIDIHEEGDTLLGRIAAHENAKAVGWLLRHGADPNVQSPQGWTPLHYAAERNRGVRVVRMLIEHGADITATTIDGQTPLDLAKLNDKPAATAFLKRMARFARSGGGVHAAGTQRTCPSLAVTCVHSRSDSAP